MIQRPASQAPHHLPAVPTHGLPFKTRSWSGVAGGKYHLIDTMQLWDQFFPLLMSKPVVACDTETTGLDFTEKQIIGHCLSWGADASFYIPIRHVTNEKQLDPEIINPHLREFYADKSRTFIFHNGKFDLHFLQNEGIIPGGLLHDTRLMHSLLKEDDEGTALKSIAVAEIDPHADKWEKMVDEFRTKYAREHKMKKEDVHYGYVPMEIMVPYGASDTHYTWALYKKKLPEIAKDHWLKQLYLVESRLMWVLLACEHRGVFIDRPYLEGAGPELEQKALELRDKIRSVLGDVNPASPASLIDPLLAHGVKLYKTTKGGKTGKVRYSLDAEVMERLASKYEVCQQILDFRSTSKLKSTYVDSILEKLTAAWTLHCEYNQIVSTGRMSSKKPNLQNIPNQDTTIRKAFIAPKTITCQNVCGFEEEGVIIPAVCPQCGGPVLGIEDFVLAYVDYSQMELRMTGHYSRDPILLDVYNHTHQDIHTRTMCEVFGFDYDIVKSILDKEDKNDPDYANYKARRFIAKITNFLIIYGGGAKNLAAQISTPKKQYSEKECQGFIDLYFKKYKGVKLWIIRTKRELRDAGYLQNHFGRYRRFPELKAWLARQWHGDSKWKIEHAERQGVNFLIQGTCADLFKIAMVRANDVLRGTRSRVVMPIHDELVFFMHRKELSHLKEIKRQMEDFDFEVPMTVDISYSSTNWAAKKGLKLAA
jgi:DNA polymerase I